MTPAAPATQCRHMTRPKEDKITAMPRLHLRPLWLRAACLAALACLGTNAAAPAQQQDGAFGEVIRIELDAFRAEAGTITFSELPVGTRSPVFYPSNYGAPETGVLVGFSGFFEDQRPGTAAECPPNTKVSGCVSGMSFAPLRLASNAPDTVIAQDGANPHSPSLSGSPRFNGPVSFVFDKDVAGVGLAGGFFDGRQTTAITGYDRQGQLIGGVRNLRTGMDYMALVTSDGSNRIAGIQFSLVGAEQAGFGIDDLAFALSSQLNREKIEGIAPAEPAALPESSPQTLPAADPELFNAPAPKSAFRQYMRPTKPKMP